MKVRRQYLAFFLPLLPALIVVGCAKRPSMVQASAPAPAGTAAAGVGTSEETGPSTAGASGSEETEQRRATEPSGGATTAPPGPEQAAATPPAAPSGPAEIGSEGATAGATAAGATAGGAAQQPAASSAGSTESSSAPASGGGTTVAGPAGPANLSGAESVAGTASARGSTDGSAGTAASAAAAAGTETVALARPGDQPGDQLIAAARPALKEYSAVPELQDVHFGFDKYTIVSEDVKILDANAAWLKSNPTYLVLVEGHCDERGTNEYNIALGQHRAKSAMDYLVSRGVLASRITTISYGEERPLCTEHTEDCWAKNRRAHFLVKAQ